MNRKHFVAITGILLILLVIIGCGGKETGIAGIAMYDDGEAPAIPQGIQVRSIYLFTNPTLGSNDKRYQVVVRWNKVTKNINDKQKDNIIGYKIFRNDTNTPIGIVDKDTLIFEDNSTDLREGKSYTYYVTAFDSLLRETRSDGQRITISPSNASGHMPDRPLNVIVIREANRTATMVWDKPQNISDLAEANDPIDSYIIYRQVGENGNPELIAQVGASVQFFSDPTVVEGTRYYYRVRAVTKSGLLGIESETKSVIITYNYNDDGFAPAAPIWSSVTEITSGGNPNARRLTWQTPPYKDNGTNGNESAGDISGYKIYRAESKNGDYLLATITGNVTSWIDVNTIGINKEPIDYWYKIAAYDYSGNTGDFSQALKVGVNPVGTPQNFAGEIDQYDQITISWTKEPNKTYNIYESMNGKIYRKMRENYSPTGADWSTVSFQPRKVTDSKFYFYKVAAVDLTSNNESNKTYFVRLNKFSGATGPQVIELNAASLISSVQVRAITFANTNFNVGWDNITNTEYFLRTEARTINSQNVQTLYFNSRGTTEYLSTATDYYWQSDGNSSTTSDPSVGANTQRRYSDQFRFVWIPQVTGVYNIDLNMVNTSTGGNYSVLIRTSSSVVGSQYSQIFNSATPDIFSLDWPGVYLNAYDPVYFVFSCLGTNGAHTNGNNSVEISTIRIERQDN
ncbi:MAG: fibronectin type III domain-containing protein [Candidatus Muiribacteriota bacterium]